MASQGRSIAVKVAAVTAALVVLISACGGSSSSDTKKDPAKGVDESGGALVIDGVEIADAALYAEAEDEGEVVIYFAYPEEQFGAILDDFEDDTGIKTERLRLPGGRLHERILSEAGGNALDADIIHTSDTAFANEYIDEGLYQQYTPPTADGVDERARQADDYYIGVTVNTFGLAYNTKKLDASEAPEGWNDLLDPELKGKIGIFDIGVGGTSWLTAMFQRQVLGEDYWEQLAAQDPKLYTGGAALVDDLARGEIAVGVASGGTTRAAVETGAPLEFIVPTEGLPAVADALGVTTVGSNPAAAKVLENWMVSPVGAQSIVEHTKDYASNLDAAEGMDFPPVDVLWFPDPDEWLELRDQWSADWTGVFGSPS